LSASGTEARPGDQITVSLIDKARDIRGQDESLSSASDPSAWRFELDDVGHSSPAFDRLKAMLVVKSMEGPANLLVNET
jgi:hypothetical protein